MPKVHRTLSIAALLLALLLVPAFTVAAQAFPATSSLTLSETAINDGLRNLAGEAAGDLSIDLQAGQLVIAFSAAGQRGKVNRFALTVVPSVSATNQLELTATHLTLNDLEVSLGNNRGNAAIDNAVSGVSDYLTRSVANGTLQNVVVTDSQLTLVWLNAGVDDPGVTIVDNLFSLTFSETSINRLPPVAAPIDSRVSAVSVDLQPGRVLINVIYAAQPAPIVYELIPTVVNDRVTWQINATADIEGSLTSTIVTVWRAYFDGIYQQDGLVNVVVTDSQITFTWDIEALASDPDSEPVVTYRATEGEVNLTLAAYLTESLTTFTVDMQPGQVVIRAVGTGADNAPYSASVTMVPALADGRVTWTIQTVTINDQAYDPGTVRTSDALTGAIMPGLQGTGRNPVVTAFEITDTEMVMTVRYP